MKKLIIFIFLAFSLQVCSQGNSLIETPQVDKKVELISIVFRLAGNREYNSKDFKLYTDRIEQHFAPYKNHELIQFAKKMRSEKSISYDAPMSLAIFLDDNLNPLKEFTNNSLDRWNKDDAVEFVRLLKKFYADAECDVFFNNNQELYKETVNRFSFVYKDMDLGWYSKFYGNDPTEKFKIVLALGNGGNCYGPSFVDSDGNKEVYAIMGVWAVDNSEMPTFDVNSYLPILIHEFNHSFVNPLLKENKSIFRSDGEKIFEALKYEMKVQQAYGNWETVLNEALVRASVIKYYKDHNAEKSVIENLYKKEMNNGFLWIRELVAELEKYDTNRITYPTLESYMSKIAEAYKSYSEIVGQFDAKRPKVTSIDEFENGTINLSTNTKTITINFDRPLVGEGYSIFTGHKGKEAFPKIEDIKYSEGNKSIIMKVQLEADKEYQFVLTGKSFKTADGFALKAYEVNFKTIK
jgi:hypothetical protein